MIKRSRRRRKKRRRFRDWRRLNKRDYSNEKRLRVWWTQRRSNQVQSNCRKFLRATTRRSKSQLGQKPHKKQNRPTRRK